MSEEVEERKEVPRIVKKRIVPFAEETPSQEPLFINYAQVAHAGGSAYIDVGVIDLDEILSTSSDVTFSVLTRLVMSPETLKGLGQQITTIFSAALHESNPKPSKTAHSNYRRTFRYHHTKQQSGVEVRSVLLETPPMPVPSLHFSRLADAW
jgi:hypothetical protein